ncbi:protein plastid transcriptionally active 7 [Tanacetum coccineum]
MTPHQRGRDVDNPTLPKIERFLPIPRKVENDIVRAAASHTERAFPVFNSIQGLLPSIAASSDMEEKKIGCDKKVEMVSRVRWGRFAVAALKGMFGRWLVAGFPMGILSVWIMPTMDFNLYFNVTKKDEMIRYAQERTPFVEEQVRDIWETGKLVGYDIERLKLWEDNIFVFVNKLAAEANELVEQDKDAYGGKKKAILHAISNRMNDLGFYRPEAYMRTDPFKHITKMDTHDDDE